MVAGAALPWDAIPVNVTCNGQTRYTVTADPKGNFVIAPDNPPSVTDTSVASADANPKLAAAFRGCTVQAALPGFNSSTLTIADRNLQNTPDIGTIILNREENAGGTAVSSTTASAPKDAAKAFERARTEWIEKKPDKAQKDLEKAVQVDPQFAEAWYQLGKIQEAANSSGRLQLLLQSRRRRPEIQPTVRSSSRARRSSQQVAGRRRRHRSRAPTKSPRHRSALVLQRPGELQTSQNRRRRNRRRKSPRHGSPAHHPQHRATPGRNPGRQTRLRRRPRNTCATPKPTCPPAPTSTWLNNKSPN